METQVEAKQVFTVPEGTFEAFEETFMDPHGIRECEPGVYRGEPEGIGVNLVRIVRNEPDLGVFIREQVGDSGLGMEYNFVLTHNNRVMIPLVLGCGPFPSEDFYVDVRLREMMPTEPDQAKVEQLFELAKQTITLSR